MIQNSKWPKKLAPLTPEQEQINDAFMKLWHEVLPKRFGVIDRFNHEYPVRNSALGFMTTLEIGAGLGEHLNYETLSPEQMEAYYALEMRENMAAQIRQRFPKVRTLVGDCQAHLDFTDGFFDRILAIHVLEHLPDLPSCVKEVYRLCNKQSGQFLVLIPCEGSPAYGLARKISAERVYKKHFGGSYKWIYTREHINLPHEILEELAPYFIVKAKSFFPLSFLPFTWCNLVIGLSLVPRPEVQVAG